MALTSTLISIQTYVCQNTGNSGAFSTNDLSQVGLKDLDRGKFTDIDKLFGAKLLSLDENSVEISKFILNLDSSINWRSLRLKKIIYAKAQNKEELKVYILQNRERINKNDPSALKELLAKVDPALHEELKTAWLDNSPHNVLMTELYYNCLAKLKDKFTKNIDMQSDNCQPNQLYFSRKLQAALKNNDLSMVSRDYNKDDLLEYKKTLFYLSNQNSPEKTLYLTFLYFNSCIDYCFNDEYGSTAELIKSKKGDCSEAASLYYTVLKMQGMVYPEFWYFLDEENVSSIKHGYGQFYYKNNYYIYDNESIDRGSSYEETMRNSTTKNKFKVVKETAPEILLLK